ncbi:MAG: hypothetical protein M3343_02560 [Actinomycetota bacterium]|nr:hypothetical protein [Actinomycetota bacterium]
MRKRVSTRITVLLAAMFVLAALVPGVASQASSLDTITTQNQGGVVFTELDPDRKAIRAALTPKAMRAAEPLDMNLSLSEAEDLTDGDSAGGSGPVVSVSPTDPETLDGPAVNLNTLQRDGSDSKTSANDIPFTRTEVTDMASFPNRTHGKLFMLEGGVPFAVCSGTVVNSQLRNVVWTAGHCVHEGEGGSFFEDFAFVPGYRNGNEPHGVWFAENAVTTNGWISEGDFELDVAALVMEPLGGEEILEAVGARGIRFNQNPIQSYKAFGYPAAPPFDGEKMFRCNSGSELLLGTGNLKPIAIGCDMTGGSSGGGWVVGDQFVQSVVSFGIINDPDFEDILFGPQLRATALDVYEFVGGAPTGPGPDTTAPKITKVSDAPDPFTPLGKKKRKTTISFKINERAVVPSTIKGKSGKTVFKIPAAELAAGSYFFKWNGRHFKTGKVVKAGTYTYTIKATDLAGNSSKKSGKTTVKR